jgi:hypothetical protein
LKMHGTTNPKELSLSTSLQLLSCSVNSPSFTDPHNALSRDPEYGTLFEPVQCIPRNISFLPIFILILFFRLTPRFPGCFFPSSFTTEVLCALVLYPMRVTCPVHFNTSLLITPVIVLSICGL